MMMKLFVMPSETSHAVIRHKLFFQWNPEIKNVDKNEKVININLYRLQLEFSKEEKRFFETIMKQKVICKKALQFAFYREMKC